MNALYIILFVLAVRFALEAAAAAADRRSPRSAGGVPAAQSRSNEADALHFDSMDFRNMGDARFQGDPHLWLENSHLQDDARFD